MWSVECDFCITISFAVFFLCCFAALLRRVVNTCKYENGFDYCCCDLTKDIKIPRDLSERRSIRNRSQSVGLFSIQVQQETGTDNPDFVAAVPDDEAPPPYDPNYIPPIPNIDDPPPPFSSIFEPNPVYIPSVEIYGSNRNRTEGHEATIVRPPSYESIINERGQTQTTHQ